MQTKISLEKAKNLYQGEWLAFLVTEETPSGELIGELIAHNRDRRELHRQLRDNKVKEAYITLAGPIIKPGYTVMF